MTSEPYNRAMNARAEAEAQVLQKPKRFSRLDAECFEHMASKLLGGKAPMHMTYAEKVRAGLGLPPPLERLQNVAETLWAYAKEVAQFSTSMQEIALRGAILDLSTAATAIIAQWRKQEIKRLETEK